MKRPDLGDPSRCLPTTSLLGGVITSVQNMSSAPLPGNWFHMQTFGD